ncbi:HAD family hydrolase [Streptomyces sp. BE133]|uniref:HAD family hydrolase n=1 Tax=Streptomyces sp. BE133 TaxID=3002523 RepID=UPI002E777FCB|nr:HAD family hydrolase [Streptomyces sp. BE133]MEE1813347.1 HAD family hydrolase [Streptomyces sp. BE133]
MPTDSLVALVATSDAVLFDFDGPICDVFAGMPAPGVAKALSGIVAEQAPEFAPEAEATDDPMEVHRLSQLGGPSLLATVESALTAAEVAAVAVAGPPIGGAVWALKAAHSTGRKVAVVSNNSAECVKVFLALHSLDEFVHEVVGRPELNPALMKPSPHPLLVASTTLGVAPARSVLVGDSVTDIEAAKAAGMHVIGFANKPPKRTALPSAGADAVIASMETLAKALARRIPGR